MENESRNKFESVYSNKVKAGKRRTYFFDVRQTKGEDYYITLTESTKKFNGHGYERHKIFLYKEDFNRFVNGLQDVVDYVKTELMPDFDYEEYERREEEWQKIKAQEAEEAKNNPPVEEVQETESVEESVSVEETESVEEVAETEESTPIQEGEESAEDAASSEVDSSSKSEEDIDSEEDMTW